MKKIFFLHTCALTTVLGIMLLTGCSMQESGEADDDLQYVDEELEIPVEDTDDYDEDEYYSEAIRLSDECDEVLACGYDKDFENYYELVVTQTESYNNVDTEMGVILNNEWLVPLTPEHPILSKTGTSYKAQYYYVEDGCFYIDTDEIGHGNDAGFFYNSHTNEYMDCNMGNYSTSVLLDKDEVYNENSEENEQRIFTDNGKVVIENVLDMSGFRIDVYILDLKTMELNKIVSEAKEECLGPISEGVFAVGSGYDGRITGFYDENYEKVLDMEPFKEQWAGKELNPKFKDGNYSFYVTNELGNKFQVTIDKQGTIIAENAITD